MTGINEKGSAKKQDVKKMTDRQLLEMIPQMMKRLDEYERDIASMRNKMDEHENEIITLKVKLEEKEEENKELAEEVKGLQQRSRHINVVIRGINEQRRENVWEIVENVGKKIGFENPGNDIQTCHRVPTRATGPRPIVVRLLNTKTRDKWIKAYKEKQLWKQKLFVTEHLTPYYQNIFFHTRKLAQEKGYKFAWTKDCQIYLKKDEKSQLHVIRRMSDLDPIRSGLLQTRLEDTTVSNE
uniref:FP protein C-terminal domain-containing protein n=1 Tax=Cacopsylla melanoneura TaxID=428564 RepID=A0A8D8Z5C6_9HEMI